MFLINTEFQGIDRNYLLQRRQKTRDTRHTPRGRPAMHAYQGLLEQEPHRHVRARGTEPSSCEMRGVVRQTLPSDLVRSNGRERNSGGLLVVEEARSERTRRGRHKTRQFQSNSHATVCGIESLTCAQHASTARVGETSRGESRSGEGRGRPARGRFRENLRTITNIYKKDASFGGIARGCRVARKESGADGGGRAVSPPRARHEVCKATYRARHSHAKALSPNVSACPRTIS